MESVKKHWAHRALAALFILTFILAIGFCFYHYFYTQNYDYLVEASCDPNSENCFYRDCDLLPEECPPNQLSFYTQYQLKAYDFKTCADNSCKKECEGGVIACEKIVCGSDSGDVCMQYDAEKDIDEILINEVSSE